MIVIVNWYGKKEDKERISRLMDGMAGWIDGHADVLGAFSSSSGSLLSCPPRFLHSCILARILPVLFLAFFGSILSFSSTYFRRTFLRNIENFWGR